MLYTERLKLRAAEPGDAEELALLLDDPRIARWTAAIPHPYRLEDARQWLASEVRGARWLIEQRGRVGIIGGMDLCLLDDPREARVGYWIAPRYWGNGYATEALREVLRIGFEEHGLLKVQAMHAVENPASGRVMEKAGMVREGFFEQGFQREGMVSPALRYGIFLDGWKRRRQATKTVPQHGYLI